MSTDNSNQEPVNPGEWPISRLRGLKPEDLHAMCKQAAAQVRQSDARMREIEEALQVLETLPDFELVRQMLSKQLGFEMSPKDVVIHIMKEKVEQLQARAAQKGR